MRILSAVLFVAGCVAFGWGTLQVIARRSEFPWLGMTGFLLLVAALWTLPLSNQKNSSS